MTGNQPTENQIKKDDNLCHPPEDKQGHQTDDGKKPALVCAGYSFRYASSEHHVIKDCSFQLNYGEFMVLSGFSGEGKSTLLSSINGAIPHYISGEQTGEIWLDGQSVKGMSMAKRARLAGTVLQNADHQIVHATVEDEIAFGCENLNMPPEKIQQQIDRVCELFSLLPSWPTKTLSGGQKQRLMTASTLAMNQRILIFDEPLANLDMKSAHILLRILKKLTAQNYAVLFIEHRLEMVLPFANKAAWLEDGRLEVFDEPSHILKKREESARFINLNADTDKNDEGHHALFTSQSERKNDLDRICHIPSGEASALKPLIEAQKLLYQAGGNTIINQISLSVFRGDSLVLLGDNGSGKTTLMQLMAHLIRPTGGKIVQSVLDHKAGGSPKWFRHVGYVYQDPSYQLFMPSVAEEIGYQSSDSLRTEQFIELYELLQFTDAHPQILSEGQKRRVSIAAIHAANPEILLLDEPTVGQDTKHLQQMIRALQLWLEHERGTLIFSTHDYRCASALAKRAIWIDQGKIIKSGGKEVIEAFFTQPLETWNLE